MYEKLRVGKVWLITAYETGEFQPRGIVPFSHMFLELFWNYGLKKAEFVLLLLTFGKIEIGKSKPCKHGKRHGEALSSVA